MKLVKKKKKWGPFGIGVWGCWMEEKIKFSEFYTPLHISSKISEDADEFCDHILLPKRPEVNINSYEPLKWIQIVQTL